MKIFSLTALILIIFFKTGNVLSKDSIFDVNNIEIIKKSNVSNQEMANQAIKRGFELLKKKILLQTDFKKLSKLSFLEIKELVSYYQVQNLNNKMKDQEVFIYNISFDKDKLHNLFYIKNIAYAEITNKEIFLLPIFLKDNEINVYNNNYFYEKWNLNNENKLVEFILPLENIEIIQQIKENEDNLLNISLENLFQGYNNKNLAIAIIQINSLRNIQIFLKTKILDKKINKSIKINNLKDFNEDFYLNLTSTIEQELINLIKSQNLIDVKTPSFLNTKFKLKKRNNLVELNSRLEKIGLIENIYVQELNNEYVNLKIKYLGKLNKIINLLKSQNIILKLSGEEWTLEIIG